MCPPLDLVGDSFLRSGGGPPTKRKNQSVRSDGVIANLLIYSKLWRSQTRYNERIGPIPSLLCKPGFSGRTEPWVRVAQTFVRREGSQWILSCRNWQPIERTWARPKVASPTNGRLGLRPIFTRLRFLAKLQIRQDFPQSWQSHTPLLDSTFR